jgi:hypothetical protein
MNVPETTIPDCNGPCEPESLTFDATEYGPQIGLRVYIEVVAPECRPCVELDRGGAERLRDLLNAALG